jgi:hypothetical protein
MTILSIHKRLRPGTMPDYNWNDPNRSANAHANINQWYVSDRIITLGPQRNRYPEVQNRIGYVQAGDGTSMFLILWEYDVKPGWEEQYERVYGPDGDWAQLFRGDPAYQRTLLLRDPFRSLTYLTCDFWETREAYEMFRVSHAVAYEALDQRCEELTLAEREIGAFEKAVESD